MDRSHGSPYDRGYADFYYWRPMRPHKYPNGTYHAPRVENLTPEEIREYRQGYNDAEEVGERKDWD